MRSHGRVRAYPRHPAPPAGRVPLRGDAVPRATASQQGAAATDRLLHVGRRPPRRDARRDTHPRLPQQQSAVGPDAVRGYPGSLPDPGAVDLHVPRREEVPLRVAAFDDEEAGKDQGAGETDDDGAGHAAVQSDRGVYGGRQVRTHLPQHHLAHQPPAREERR